ncbi:ribbon-helix-helix domain-containing protein [Vibrio parahaemolyticus]|nr:ribbon-helix-helix domain-containing protein [Vibrio parahaemolyticus]
MLDFDEDGSDGGRSQYPDAIRFRSPHGFREGVKFAARAEGVSQSEFIRRAIGHRIEGLCAESPSTASCGLGS